jgi:hypothetical protein
MNKTFFENIKEMDYLKINNDYRMMGHLSNSVKSPNEAKPGMKMSTYGGEKRRMSTRYNYNIV